MVFFSRKSYQKLSYGSISDFLIGKVHAGVAQALVELRLGDAAVAWNAAFKVSEVS